MAGEGGRGAGVGVEERVDDGVEERFEDGIETRVEVAGVEKGVDVDEGGDEERVDGVDMIVSS